MVDAARVQALLCALSQDVRDFSGGSVERISEPTALQFLRDYVAQSRPCVITGVASAWPAAQRWLDDAYLCERMAGEPDVAVNVTPHGRGDALHACAEHGGEELFILPAEERMPFATFLSSLDAAGDAPHASPEGVPYVSAQNGSLRADFAPLAADVPAALPWAAEAFGGAPDAVNLWVGNAAAETAFHADPYENVYAVLRGEKRFTLLPPSDSFRLYPARRRVARFVRHAASHTGWTVALEQPPRRVAWARVQPHPPNADAAADAAAAFPMYFATHMPPPLQVTLRAGEILYLPANWQHHVRQAGRRVIAVNWWHDQTYDHRYAHAQLVRGLGAALAAARGEDAEEEEEEEEEEED